LRLVVDRDLDQALGLVVWRGLVEQQDELKDEDRLRALWTGDDEFVAREGRRDFRQGRVQDVSGSDVILEDGGDGERAGKGESCRGGQRA
jgi:hypothetical protein